jgi:hypothetical protein
MVEFRKEFQFRPDAIGDSGDTVYLVTSNQLEQLVCPEIAEHPLQGRGIILPKFLAWVLSPSIHSTRLAHGT